MFSVIHPSIVISSAALRNNQFRVSKCQEYEHDLNMSRIQSAVDIKDTGHFDSFFFHSMNFVNSILQLFCMFSAI